MKTINEICDKYRYELSLEVYKHRNSITDKRIREFFELMKQELCRHRQDELERHQSTDTHGVMGGGRI